MNAITIAHARREVEIEAYTHTRREAQSITDAIAEGHSVEWRRSAFDPWLTVEGCAAFGRDLYFAFTDGREVVCRFSLDRSQNLYSLQWRGKRVGPMPTLDGRPANDLVREGTI